MKLKSSVWLILVLAVMCVAPFGALAGASDPAQAERLFNDVPLGGTLTGSRAGAFAYYRIEYPGDDRVISVELSVTPGDPAMMQGVGINLYGPNGFKMGEPVPIGSGVAVLYGDNVRATWIVQVYNYLPDVTVQYSIVARGLPEVPAPTAATVATPVVAPAPAAAPRMSGALLGNRGGAFARIPLEYAGDGSEVRYKLIFSPDDPVVVNGVGLTVYGPDGRAWAGQPTGTPGERVVAFSSSVAGRYELVVYNYIEGLVIQYSVSR